MFIFLFYFILFFFGGGGGVCVHIFMHVCVFKHVCVCTHLYNILSANHVAVAKCIKACRHGQEVQLFFRLNVRMGKKCDLSDFDHGMIIGARQGGLSQKLLISWDFHAQQSLEFADNGLKNKKTFSEQQVCGQNIRCE